MNRRIELYLALVIIALVIIIPLVIMGPSGIKTGCMGWKASAYGSDWLVVQYAQSGCIISTWELENEAIKNEQDSDGIFFVAPEGVVHLSGHYVYVQLTEEDSLVEAKHQLTGTGKCAD